MEEDILETFIQVLMESGTETPGKNLVSWKILIRSIVCSNYYDISVNEYGVKCGTSCRFWENNGWINSIDRYGWLQWYFRYW